MNSNHHHNNGSDAAHQQCGQIDWNNWIYDGGTFVARYETCTPVTEEEIRYHYGHDGPTDVTIPEQLEFFCQQCGNSINLFAPDVLVKVNAIDYDLRCDQCGHSNSVANSDQLLFWKEFAKMPYVCPAESPPGKGHNNIFCLNEVDQYDWLFDGTFVVNCRNCGFIPISRDELLSLGTMMQLPDQDELFCEQCGHFMDIFSADFIMGYNGKYHGIRCSDCGHEMPKDENFLAKWKEMALRSNVYPNINPPGQGHNNIFCYDAFNFKDWLYDGTFVVHCDNCDDYIPCAPDNLVSPDPGLPLPDTDEIICNQCYNSFDLFRSGAVTGNDLDGYRLACEYCGSLHNTSRELLLKWKHMAKQPHIFPGATPPGDGHANIFCVDEIAWDSWVYDDTYVVYCKNCRHHVDTTPEELIAHGQDLDYCFRCQEGHGQTVEDMKRNFYYYGTYAAYCEDCDDYYPIHPDMLEEHGIANYPPDEAAVWCRHCGQFIDLRINSAVNGSHSNGYTVSCPGCGTAHSVGEDVLSRWKWYLSTVLNYLDPCEGYEEGEHNNFLCFDEVLGDKWIYDDTFVVYCDNCKDFVHAGDEGIEYKGMPFPREELSCEHCSCRMNLTMASAIEASGEDSPYLICPQCGTYKYMDHESMLFWKEFTGETNVYPSYEHTPENHGNILCYEEMDWAQWVEGDGTYVVPCHGCSHMVGVAPEEIVRHGHALTPSRFCDSCQRDVYPDWGAFTIECEENSPAMRSNGSLLDSYRYFLHCPECGETMLATIDEMLDAFSKMRPIQTPDYPLTKKEKKNPITVSVDRLSDEGDVTVRLHCDLRDFVSGDYEQFEIYVTKFNTFRKHMAVGGWIRVSTRINDGYFQANIPDEIFQYHQEHNIAGATAFGNLFCNVNENDWYGGFGIKSEGLGINLEYMWNKEGKQTITFNKDIKSGRYSSNVSIFFDPSKSEPTSKIGISGGGQIQKILNDKDHIYLKLRNDKLQDLLDLKKWAFELGYKCEF